MSLFRPHAPKSYRTPPALMAKLTTGASRQSSLAQDSTGERAKRLLAAANAYLKVKRGQPQPSMAAVAREHCVPYATLHRVIKRGGVIAKRGRPTALSAVTEEQLRDLVVRGQRQGVGVTKTALLAAVRTTQRVMERKGKVDPFKGKAPGKNWRQGKVAAKWLRKGGRAVVALISPDGSAIPQPEVTPHGLPDAIKAQLDSLLAEYSDVFTPLTGLPPDRSVGHTIPLEPCNRPAATPMYRLSKPEHDELKQQIQDLLAKDYRQLNKITLRDQYPLPRIDDLFDKLSGCKVFSSLDLQAGYHQIRITPKDVPKTAFRTPEGHFQFKVLCFGLTNAPATFQRVMNDAFATVLGKCALVYLDDILVMSSRKLSPAEINYTTGEQEFLSLVTACKEWRCYLEGVPFTLFTDHQPLVALPTQKVLSRRQARWMEFMSRFSYSLVHIAGTVNPADPLSRIVHDSPESVSVCAVTTRRQAKLSLEGGGAREAGLRAAAPAAISAKSPLALSQFEKDTTCVEAMLDPIGSETPVTQDETAQYPAAPAAPMGLSDQLTLGYQQDPAFAAEADHSGMYQDTDGLWRISGYRWEHVSMDLVTKLPTGTHGYDAICVIVDRLSKMVHFVPCKEAMNAMAFTRLFINNVFRLHGLPAEVLTDRGAHFNNKFWHAVKKLLGMKTNMSTAYRPQSDGQTERYNRVLEEMLRHYISPTQADWPDHLALAEFAVNNSWQESIHSTPFFLNIGQSPVTPGLRDLPDGGRCPSAHAFATWWKEGVAHARRHMADAQARYKRHADTGLKDVEFEVGAQVLLSTRNLRIKTGKVRKFVPRYVGPFVVEAKINANAYRLTLPANMSRLHPVFHVCVPLLKKYSGSDVGIMPPPVEWMDETPVYYVERLLDHRHVRAGKAGEFLVQWEGYDASFNTWEPRANLTGCDKLLAEYNAIHSSPRSPGHLGLLGMALLKGAVLASKGKLAARKLRDATARGLAAAGQWVGGEPSASSPSLDPMDAEAAAPTASCRTEVTGPGAVAHLPAQELGPSTGLGTRLSTVRVGPGELQGSQPPRWLDTAARAPPRPSPDDRRARREERQRVAQCRSRRGNTQPATQPARGGPSRRRYGIPSSGSSSEEWKARRAGHQQAGRQRAAQLGHGSPHVRRYGLLSPSASLASSLGTSCGLAQPHKLQALLDWAADSPAQVVFLQECHRAESVWQWAEAHSGAKPAWRGQWFYSPGTGSSQGCLVLVKPSTILQGCTQVQLQAEGAQGRVLRVDGELAGRPVSLVCVYAPAQQAERPAFYAECLPACLPPSADRRLLLMGGDFNCILAPVDRVGIPQGSQHGEAWVGSRGQV
ncbi:hypothetical protein QJQ45_000984 [Haematococcus lacustris]|nr:hypothetical protein QJQ45_000984 [Haematococcus lacustris]